jgi:hypothetical protein
VWVVESVPERYGIGERRWKSYIGQLSGAGQQCGVKRKSTWRSWSVADIPGSVEKQFEGRAELVNQSRVAGLKRCGLIGASAKVW